MIKNLLQEIRQQPPHIREVFMWVCVVIVFSVVGWAWFRQTQKQFVALLHPEQAEEARVLAEENKQKQPPSPFATIFSSLGDLRANISELFAGSKPNVLEFGSSVNPQQEVPPNELPLSDDK